MRVMHVIDSLRIGGAERMLVDLANQTAAEGDQVSVTITRNGTDLASELQSAIGLTIIARQTRFDWPAMRRFAGLVKEQGTEILHAHGRTSLELLALLKALGLIHVPI